MNVDTGTDPRDLTGLDALKKKAPRKPRPSELAAKNAKAAKGARKPAPTKKKAVKTKKPVKKTATAKKGRGKVSKAKRPAPKRAKAKVDTREKPCRIDCRVTKAEKVRITAKAKRLRRTVTSLLVEAVQKIK